MSLLAIATYSQSLPLLNPQSTSNFGDTLDGTLGSCKLTAVWKDLGPGQGVLGNNGCNIPLHSYAKVTTSY